MAMRAGRLNEPVCLMTPVKVKDARGQLTTSYTATATRRAEIRQSRQADMKGDGKGGGERINAEITATVRIRYDSGLDIDSTWRIMDSKGRIYEVVGIPSNVYNKNKEYLISVRAVDR